MYGYTDSDSVTPGKQGGKFGLNKGFLTKFEYNPNAGKDGAEQDGIDLNIQVGEREYMQRFFPVTKVFAKGGGELTDTNSDEYKEEYAKAVKLFTATLTSIVECFVASEDIRTALAAPSNNFKDYAQVLQRLVQSVPNWNKQEIDVFLQYQWTPKGENDKTFLELPKNVKHGIYVVRNQGEGFVEDRTETHLKYVNAEGMTHPFKRTEWFVKNAFANQASLAPASGAAIAGTPGGASTGNW
jgi:hypothetical protein